jgi:hypothetical protein
MSEFGSSFHLCGIDRKEAQRITKLLKAPSLLFASPKGTTIHSLITLAPQEKIFQHYFGTLVNYNYGEDHGLYLEIYFFRKQILEANITWEAGIIERNVEMDKDGLLKCGLFSDKKSFNLFLEKLNATTFENAFEIAESLNLPQHRHVQHEELRHLTADQLKEIYPSASILNFDKLEEFLPSPSPNEWCHLEGQGHFMYLPVPVVELKENIRPLFEKHKNYWLWWDKNVDLMYTLEEQFRVLEFYRRKLPEEANHLHNRFFAIGNDPQWGDARWKALEAILALIATDEERIQKLEQIILPRK